jgi:hypothetical protein
MKLISKSEASRRVNESSSVAEVNLRNAADLSKLVADLKEQTPSVILVCVK